MAAVQAIIIPAHDVQRCIERLRPARSDAGLPADPGMTDEERAVLRFVRDLCGE